MSLSRPQPFLPFDVVIMVMQLLPVRDRVRISRTSKYMRDAVRYSWKGETEIPAMISVPADAMAALMNQFRDLEVVDFALLSPETLRLVSPSKLARRCRKITSFRSVRMENLEFVSTYVSCLNLSPDCVPLESLEMLLDDWQVDSPYLYQEMRCILSACGKLVIISLDNDSYGLLNPNEVWRLIGSRVTSLRITCPYVSSISVFNPGQALRSISTPMTQADFDLLCRNCPQLQFLEETTFFREHLPTHWAVVAVQSDPNNDSDLILDMERLKLLRNLQSLSLTSLITDTSQTQLNEFLEQNGRGLVSLDLNLSQSSPAILHNIAKHCPQLRKLTLFLKYTDKNTEVAELTRQAHEIKLPEATKLVLLFKQGRKSNV